MSFILDALKKSEEQRRQGSVPQLQTAQMAQPAAAGRRIWPWLLVIALLLNGILLVWWLRPWQSTPSEPIAAITPAAIPAPEPATVATEAILSPPPAAATVTPRPAPAPAGWGDLSPPEIPAGRGEGEAATVRPEPVSRPAPPPASRPKPVAAANALPHWTELPLTVRRGLPELSISLHYHTAERTARMARINGRIVREGEMIGGQLTVEEITPSGVILSSGPLRFLLGDF
ncbi:MAG: general secretion pathway protein GspB [Desulfuromonadales bacterium]|nr:general secretion pathway protein GspB [Desulfuromonadales bacterium]